MSHYWHKVTSLSHESENLTNNTNVVSNNKNWCWKKHKNSSACKTDWYALWLIIKKFDNRWHTFYDTSFYTVKYDGLSP